VKHSQAGSVIVGIIIGVVLGLAAAYHSYYDSERILVDDERLKTARLALVAACAQVLHNGLAVLGVSAPHKM
jgi:arginyl-tRNA synthetase